jgi:hypothetical protein
VLAPYFPKINLNIILQRLPFSSGDYSIQNFKSRFIPIYRLNHLTWPPRMTPSLYIISGSSLDKIVMTSRRIYGEWKRLLVFCIFTKYQGQLHLFKWNLVIPLLQKLYIRSIRIQLPWTEFHSDRSLCDMAGRSTRVNNSSAASPDTKAQSRRAPHCWVVISLVAVFVLICSSTFLGMKS